MPARKRTAPEPIAASTAGDHVTLTVHKSLYPPDVLFGTAFTFLDRCYVFLDVADKDRTRVELTPRPASAWTAEALAGEFCNELVTQAVRLRLAKETEKVRSLIVGRAIGEALPGPEAPPASPGLADLPPEVAKILAEEESDLDFLDDPLGIAIPWEEKYGKTSPKDEGTPAGKAPAGEDR